MFERLMLCDYAVADLTTANPNVFYELGIRHAVRPATTVTIFARHQAIPFDVTFLRALPYDLTRENRFTPEQAALLRAGLGARLRELRGMARDGAAIDSPVFQLIAGYEPPGIAHLKTDVFRERAQYAASLKKRLAVVRRENDAALAQRIEQELEPLHEGDVGVLVDLYLTYRSLKQWDRMIGLYERLPEELKRAVMMREQLGFALNRAGRRDEALDVLEAVVEEQGPSSETCGLIGRVYKDCWAEAVRQKKASAPGYLNNAIDAYVRGFEADWRDAYPGVNAVTLLDIRGDEASLARKREMLPVVRFAVTQRVKSSKPDYWDHATLLELAVLEGGEAAARQHLGDALACVREPWEPETTANNLSMIRTARLQQGRAEPWLEEVLLALSNRSAEAGLEY
jgi:tetratricopeptide (TPR) repeat protein